MKQIKAEAAERLKHEVRGKRLPQTVNSISRIAQHMPSPRLVGLFYLFIYFTFVGLA